MVRHRRHRRQVHGRSSSSASHAAESGEFAVQQHDPRNAGLGLREPQAEPTQRGLVGDASAGLDRVDRCPVCRLQMTFDPATKEMKPITNGGDGGQKRDVA